MLVLPPYVGIDVYVCVCTCLGAIEVDAAKSQLKMSLLVVSWVVSNVHSSRAFSPNLTSICFFGVLTVISSAQPTKRLVQVKQRKPNREHFLCSIAAEPVRPQTKRNKLTNYGHENRQAQRGAHLHSRRVTEILKNLSSHNLSALASRKCHSTIGKVKVCSGMAYACW